MLRFIEKCAEVPAKWEAFMNSHCIKIFANFHLMLEILWYGDSKIMSLRFLWVLRNSFSEKNSAIILNTPEPFFTMSSTNLQKFII